MHICALVEQASTQLSRRCVAAGPRMCDGAVGWAVLETNAVESVVQCANFRGMYTTKPSYFSKGCAIFSALAAVLKAPRAIYNHAPE